MPNRTKLAATIAALTLAACSSTTPDSPRDGGTLGDAALDAGTTDASADAGITDATTIPPPDAPTSIQVTDPDASVLLRAAGRGVQIYGCGATDAGADDAGLDAGPTYAWTFVAPEATLFDGADASIGKHYAGPTWELNADGSKVTGAVLQRVTVDPNAIPWLLLKATSNTGTGTLARARFIQRVQTTAGKAPAAAGCDSTTAGTQSRVDYTADYYFWGN